MASSTGGSPSSFTVSLGLVLTYSIPGLGASAKVALSLRAAPTYILVPMALYGPWAAGNSRGTVSPGHVPSLPLMPDPVLESGAGVGGDTLIPA